MVLVEMQQQRPPRSSSVRGLHTIERYEAPYLMLYNEDPFEGVDLTAVPYDTYDWLALAREAAEDAEIELFDPAIEDAVAEGDEWLGASFFY